MAIEYYEYRKVILDIFTPAIYTLAKHIILISIIDKYIMCNNSLINLNRCYF